MKGNNMWLKKPKTTFPAINAPQGGKKDADLDPFKVGQVLINLATQLGRDLENGFVVLHHEGHKFGGEQLVQIHLVGRAQNTR